mmetsp:Transcript_16338/g.41542  ORF Transcript_16338/g.41542 Transcript_16338/m.41542 type:complete len:122 (+) Transcript_16338:370-735(+)
MCVCLCVGSAGLGDALVMVWLFWVLGQSSNDAGVLARYSGIVKSVQAGGSALSWKLNSAGAGVPPSAQFAINVALAAVGLATAFAATRTAPFDLEKTTSRRPPDEGAAATGREEDEGSALL